jgi:hypothetical protein
MIFLKELNASELFKLSRVQAVMKGKLERIRHKVRKANKVMTSAYFKDEEARETIVKDAKKATKTEKRRHEYVCSGAVYDGEWLGGLRHGQGTITWKDGASYEGAWKDNMAHGQGKFTSP